MQIRCMPILKVIFMLSTIVSVTDCCSSRILLLRQHTLQIEEHVVQLVNQLELQQQPSQTDMFTDTGQTMEQLQLQLSPEVNFVGELASIATTEQTLRESSSSTELWSTDAETKTTTTATTTTTTTTITNTTTNTLATGEPPPNDDTTPRLATDDAIFELNETSPATTTTTTTSLMTTPTSKPKVTDELSFKLPCNDAYTKYFCLNGGNCFRWANADSFSYCVCANGYVGERCDSKTENGVYVPLQPPTSEPQLKTAHIVFSFPMLIMLSTIYVVFGAVFMFRNVSAQRRKQQQIHLHKQRFFVSC